MDNCCLIVEGLMYQLSPFLFFLVQSVSAVSAVKVETLYRAPTIVTGVQEQSEDNGCSAAGFATSIAELRRENPKCVNRTMDAPIASICLLKTWLHS